MILVVDDHWETGRSIERLLTFHGYPVRTATSGYEGVLLARDCPPRLILADEHLHDLPRGNLLRELRNYSQLRDIPVVFYAPREPSAERDHSVNFSARDWLRAAHVHWDELLPRIEHAYADTPPLTVASAPFFIAG